MPGKELQSRWAKSSTDSTGSRKYFEVFRTTHESEKHRWQSDRAQMDYKLIINKSGERLSKLPEGSQLGFNEEEEVNSHVLVNGRYEKYGFKQGARPGLRKKSFKSSSRRPSLQPSEESLCTEIQELRNMLKENKRRMSEMEVQIILGWEQITKLYELVDKHQNQSIQKLGQQLNQPSDHP